MSTLTRAPAAPKIVVPPLHPGQQAVRRGMRRFSLLCAGRRWRKTTLNMVRAVWEANRGNRILWGAPVFDQVFIGWEEALKATRGVARPNQTRMTLDFPSGGRISYRSLDDPDNARGHTVDGVVLDEAPEIRPEAWHEVIRPMLMDTGGWAVLGGTPKGRGNWFSQLMESWLTEPDAAVWQIPTRGYAITDGGQIVQAPHPLENPHIPWAEIEHLWRTTPETTFRQEIGAEVITDAYDLFTREMFEQRRFDAAAFTPASKVAARYLSWDTAFKDTDSAAYSACVVGELLDTYELRITEVWRDRVTFPNLVAQMERMRRRHNADGKLRAEVIEDKASGTSAYQTLRAVRAQDDPVQLVPFQPTGSKDERASLAGVWAKHGLIWLPTPGPAAPWLLAFEDELFGAGAFLDQRDAFAQLVLYLRFYLHDGLRARGVPQEMGTAA